MSLVGQWLKHPLERFRYDYPGLELRQVEPFMPFRYLLSGGVSMRALAPGWSFSFWKGVEQLLSPLSGQLAMFAYIAVERR